MGSVKSKSSNSSVGSYLEYDRIILNLSSGDLIEVQRSSYKHWVLCERIDNGVVWCFHISVPPNYDTERVSSNKKGCIKYEPLLDILKDNKSSTPSLCRINNQPNMAEKMMKTNKNGMPDIKQVFEKLHNIKDKTVEYDFTKLNCEHYSTFWKYGIGWSSQVNSCKDILKAVCYVSTIIVGTIGVTSFVFSFGIGGASILVSCVGVIDAQMIERSKSKVRPIAF